jgi:hypothetical protein
VRQAGFMQSMMCAMGVLSIQQGGHAEHYQVQQGLAHFKHARATCKQRLKLGMCTHCELMHI